VLGHHLGDPGPVYERRTHGRDRQNERAFAVGSLPDSIWPLDQAEPVENVVGLLRIERRMQLARAGTSAEQRVLRRRGTTGLTLAKPEDFVELISVDAQRERDTKVFVRQPFRDLGVRIEVLIDEKSCVAAVQPFPAADRVVLLLLILLERRQLGDTNGAREEGRASEETERRPRRNGALFNYGEPTSFVGKPPLSCCCHRSSGDA